MNHGQKILAVIGVVGSIGLVSLGIVKAQTLATTTNDQSAITAATTTPPTAPIEDERLEQGGRHQAMLEQQATLFKMTVTDLQNEIQAGKPMYQIAAEHGVTFDTIKADRLAKIETELDAKVKVGFMTQAQADEELKKFDNVPMMGFGHGMHGR